MSVIGGLIRHAMSRMSEGYGEVPDDVHEEAERIEYNTDMNYLKAFVVAADNADLDDRTIEREIAPSGRSVREVRKALRRDKMDLESERKTSEEVLGEWGE